MAKHVIGEGYTFAPASRTIVITGKTIRKESLILITNVTTNTVIYNFADSALTGVVTTLISSVDNTETTTIVLSYNTTSMGTSDKLSIIVDEINETFQPSETLVDSNSKLRVSQPQALIDTDFEYGTQTTKWETVALLNNRPSAFYDVSTPITITGISGAGTRVVTVTYTASTIPLTTSTPVFIQDPTDPNAGGWVLPTSVNTNVSFTYNALNTVASGSIYDPTKTYAYAGVFYSGASIPVSATAGAAFTNAGTVVTGTTANAHGLSVGDAIYVCGTTAVTSNPPNGHWIVRQTPTVNTFVFDVITAPVGTITASAGANATLYVRAYGSTIHRPFDGGVSFTAGTPYHGNQLIRQTRRQFRYQSGKGMMFSTGSNMCPLIPVETITSSGTTCTATFRYPHNLGPGAVIVVSGSTDTPYNGTFTVVATPTLTTLTYTALSTPSSTTAAGFPLNIGPKNWYGASARLGMFDTQNGFFFEYDGQTLYACLRRSTDQLSGYISSLANSATVATGTNTKWTTQLTPGDNIVIRGMSHTIQSIISDTSIVVYPEYKGTSITAPSQVIISKTVTTRVPQSQWNIDKMDGTGASGYNVDITKMQMWLMDYSWYGAGAIRFGFKDQQGQFKYAHRIANANVKTEAYMRSGNLPARYEANTFAPYTTLSATLSNSETGTVTVASTVGFPASGTLVITGNGNTTAPIEYITYTAKTATTFTGLTRGVVNLTGPNGLTSAGGAATGQAFTYSATAPIQVSLYSPQVGLTIGHWGSSVIMDGRYDDDKSFLFNYGMNTAVTYANPGTRYPVFSVRLAPSVDNGITGLLGARELINRMQLSPAGCGVYATAAGVKVEVWLNAKVSAGIFAPVGGSSLAQFALHANTTTMSGGECIYTFYAPAGSVSTQDMSRVRDIGNSILGGGNTLNCPTTDNNKYPDGPDILTLAVTPIANNASVTARLSWTEAQA